jgi:hypothetical protein
MPVDLDIADHELFGPLVREGRRDGASQLLRRQIEMRFGQVSRFVDQLLDASSQAELEALGLRLLDAKNLEELFAERAPAHSTLYREENMPVELGMLDRELLGPVRQGIEQGRREEARDILLMLIQKRFGLVPSWVDRRIYENSRPQNEALIARLLDAKSLEDLFA